MAEDSLLATVGGPNGIKTSRNSSVALNSTNLRGQIFAVVGIQWHHGAQRERPMVANPSAMVSTCFGILLFLRPEVA